MQGTNALRCILYEASSAFFPQDGAVTEYSEAPPGSLLKWMLTRIVHGNAPRERRECRFFD